MLDKIIELLKTRDFNVSKFLLCNYKKINISDEELILLIYLLNTNEFYPKKISEELSLDLAHVMGNISSLTDKGIIEIKTIKQNNIQSEYIDFSNMYEKLGFVYMNDDKKEETTLYDEFEKEFGRDLSPIEYELINGWKETGYSDEIILAALKEAVFNGVNNFRYIDKILYEWNKKGVKTVSDIEKNRKEFQRKKFESKPLFDYDWLSDNDE